MAEAAGERAADLARDAQRAAVLLRDVDRLHLLAVIEAKQPFARAVGGDLLGDDLGAGEGEAANRARSETPWRCWSCGQSRWHLAHRASSTTGPRACATGARARQAVRGAQQGPRGPAQSGCRGDPPAAAGCYRTRDGADMVYRSAGSSAGLTVISCQPGALPRAPAPEKPENRRGAGRLSCRCRHPSLRRRRSAPRPWDCSSSRRGASPAWT